MSNNPNFINLNFSSFKQKEEYKPPTNNFFVFQKPQQNAQKKKYIPGGEWADDSEQNKPQENQSS